MNEGLPCRHEPGRRRIGRWIGGLALAATLFPAFAQTPGFPERPIRIVPFGSAGGPIDVIARFYAEKMRQMWGQPVLIEIKTGASGAIGADFVAKAPADGHTLLFTLPLTHINVPVLTPKLSYDPVRDFAPLTMIATGSPLLLARADAPFSNLKEYVAYAKTKTGTSYGTWGIGSGAHLYGELLKRQAGIDILHVPYRAETGNFNDLYGGLLTVTWANPGTAKAQLQAGKVKLLGVTGPRRVGLLPEVKTFTEQGFPGFEVDSWIGVYAPAKTPQATLDKLTAALREITAQPDVKAMLLDRGFDPLGNTPAEFLAKYRSDYPRTEELIKAAGVTAE